MISFIVIGRNEGWKLAKCFEGIQDFVLYNSLQNIETIYVDSDSVDGSIELARIHNINKIFRISGNINAAVARNVGADAASGEILFFIDGDIELKPFNLDIIIENEYQLKYNYVVGFLDDVNYTIGWEWISQTPRSCRTEIRDRIVNTVGGGIFIIDTKTWKKFGGMDIKLKRSQDRDLSLKMARKGISGVRKSEIFGLHHTIPYKDNKRMWKMIFDGSICFRGVIIRRNLFNVKFWPKLIHEEWSMIVLIISCLLFLSNHFTIFLYIVAILIKCKKYIKKIGFKCIIHRTIQDIIVFFSILFFYPSTPKYQSQQLL